MSFPNDQHNRQISSTAMPHEGRHIYSKKAPFNNKVPAGRDILRAACSQSLLCCIERLDLWINFQYLQCYILHSKYIANRFRDKCLRCALYSAPTGLVPYNAGICYKYFVPNGTVWFYFK